MPSAHSRARFRRIYYTNPEGGQSRVRWGCKLERVIAGGGSHHDIFKQVVRLSLHGRRGCTRRSGTRSSKRGPGPRSRAFRLGRDACCYSSMGTRTAVSTPHGVTTCGPFLVVALRSSLNRVFHLVLARNPWAHPLPYCRLVGSLVNRSRVKESRERITSDKIASRV
jgi:hypothetical protein